MHERPKLELVGWALVAFVVVLLGVRLLHGESSEPAPVSVKASAGSARERGGRGKTLVVDVDGEVRRPGLLRVRAGARAGDAVRLAGGMTARADGASVNLAAPLADGQQVVVPERGAAAAAVATPGDPASGSAPAAPISLSTATV